PVTWLKFLGMSGNLSQVTGVAVHRVVVFGKKFVLSAQLLFSPSPPQKRRRGPGRGGTSYQFPLSPTLSPLVPRGEREAKRRRRFACRTQRFTEMRYGPSHWLTTADSRKGWGQLAPTSFESYLIRSG